MNVRGGQIGRPHTGPTYRREEARHVISVPVMGTFKCRLLPPGAAARREGALRVAASHARPREWTGNVHKTRSF